VRCRAGGRGAGGHEAACRTDHHSGRTWSPIGQTPVVRNLGKHESIGMASAISMRGAMFWMTFDGTMNSALFTEFLDLLIHDIDGKIFLIVDHARYHTSKETSEWVKEGSKAAGRTARYDPCAVMPQDAPPNGSAPGPAPQGPWSRVAGMQAKPPSLPETAAALPHVPGSPRPGVLRRLRPVPGRSADSGPSPDPRAGRARTGQAGTVSVLTAIRSTKEEPSSIPAASPRLRRSHSPWPPGAHPHVRPGVPRPRNGGNGCAPLPAPIRQI
jgi:DDE superfamily endonuclease